jgi:hypothetical protein
MKASNNQGNDDQKEKHWRYHNSQLQSVLQSLRNKNSTVLVEKQIWTQVEQVTKSDINVRSYAHLSFEKGAKNIWWRKDSLFNKCCCENWLSECRKLKLDECLSSCTNIKSKWIRNLNVCPDSLKLVQGRAENRL